MHFDHACALQQQSHWEEALAAYELAIAVKPDHAEAFLNRGVVLKVLGRFEDALASYNAAILLKRDFAAAYCNRGDLLSESGSWNAALASLDVAIAFAPDLAVAHSNRGNVLRHLGRHEDALASCDRALALDPEIVFLDEPTSGLDNIAAEDFDNLIRTLRQTLGLTVFMVTHDLESVGHICDRVAAIADSRTRV